MEYHIELVEALGNNALPYRIVARNFLGAHPVEWLLTLTAVPLGLGSNTEEGLDAFKCILHLRHGSRMFSRDVGGRTLTTPKVALPQIWSSTEPTRTFIRMVLKATDNDRGVSSPLPQ
ncbi:hypothetical protein TNCV_832741 [Trichonephila clavipes]|nr:hypothetical protein TNCV_832741 [Trichonephila clavipes]